LEQRECHASRRGDFFGRRYCLIVIRLVGFIRLGFFRLGFVQRLQLGFGIERRFWIEWIG
jgi:hypothetical protein